MPAQGAFRLPIARSYPFEQWRDATRLSLPGRPHGKVVLLGHAETPARATAHPETPA